MLKRDALTLKQLRALRAVIDHQSLTAAAEKLRQSVPTIHSQIKNLEGASGCNLFQRSSEVGAYAPTVQGAVLFRAACRIEAVIDQIAQEFRVLASGMTGHVTLGTVSTARYFVLSLIRLLRDRLPDIEIALKITNREEIMAALDRHSIDLAVMGRPPRAQLQRAVPLGPHPLGVVLPPDHPLAGWDGYDPSALMAETFLTRELGSGTRAMMERFLDRLGEGAPARLVELDSNETIKQAVIAGLGIAYLSLHTVTDELRSGRLVLLRGPGLPQMRHWYLVVPGPHQPSPPVVRVAEAIEALNGVYFPQVPGLDAVR